MQPHLQFIIDEPVVDCRALGGAHAAMIHGNAVLEDRLQGFGKILCVPPGQCVDDGGVCTAYRKLREIKQEYVCRQVDEGGRCAACRQHPNCRGAAAACVAVVQTSRWWWALCCLQQQPDLRARYVHTWSCALLLLSGRARNLVKCTSGSSSCKALLPAESVWADVSCHRPMIASNDALLANQVAAQGATPTRSSTSRERRVACWGQSARQQVDKHQRFPAHERYPCSKAVVRG